MGSETRKETSPRSSEEIEERLDKLGLTYWHPGADEAMKADIENEMERLEAELEEAKLQESRQNN